jgi:hypothetical protein
VQLALQAHSVITAPVTAESETVKSETVKTETAAAAVTARLWVLEQANEQALTHTVGAHTQHYIHVQCLRAYPFQRA